MASRLGLFPPTVPSLASAPGSPVNGMSYYDTTLNAYRVYTNGAWAAVGGGGGSGDLLSTLVNTPISVTGAATGTISALHIFSDSGSPANYTWNLPSPTGNTNKLIGLQVSASMTKIVTIDAGSGVTINGTTTSARTRKMWAKETAILKSDGSNWIVMSATFNPMSCNMARGSSLGASSGNVNIPMDTVLSDPTGVMADTTSPNYGIVIARPSTYLMIGTASFSLSANLLNMQAKLMVNGTQARNKAENGLSGGNVTPQCVHTAILAAGDVVKLATYMSSSSYSFYTAGPPYENQLSVLELPSW